MSILKTFSSVFGDFETMFLDTDFKYFVITLRTFFDKENYIVIGYTQLENDILLHTIEVKGISKYEELEKTEKPVYFFLLSKIINRASIDPENQLEY